MEFYTYLWLREDGTPYYVGKGKNNRAYKSDGHGVHRPKERSRIIVQYWESEEKAFDMEKWWIAFYGRKDIGTGCLRNLTDGGENPPKAWGNTNMLGKHISEEGKKRISALHKGKQHALGNKLSEETRKKMGDWRRGKPRSAETKARVSEGLRAYHKRKKDGAII